MKIAIIGDLHISTKWIGGTSVLSQIELLIDRLISYCKDSGIKVLFIAGDIVDKSIDRPEVLHTVNKIFKRLSDYFYEVHYILGQHDMAVNPVGDINEVDSNVTILDYPNIHYSHGKIIEFEGGVKIGFSNFSRNSSYKLPEYVDLYVTHFTISHRFGQKIDTSKFGLMIAGDIHHKVSIGNMHSIGSFQQQSVSRDSEENNVCIYDTSDKSFERINLGGGIPMRNSEIHAGLIDGVWYELKRTPNKPTNSETVGAMADLNFAEIVRKVSDFMEEVSMKSLNDEISSRVTDVGSYSSDFSILSLTIHNFLKIHDFASKFNVGDKVLLTGLNGSGKSTFLNALFAGLTGNLTWNHVIGKFDSEVYVEMSISYLGCLYELRRGSGLQWIKCDGVDIPYKNRNDFNNTVLSKLPFLKDVGILFQRPQVGTLFEGINSDGKLNLISKVYHLEYLDQLCHTGESIKQGKIKEISSLGYDIKSLESKESELQSNISSLLEASELNLDDLNSRYDYLMSLKSSADKFKEVSEKVRNLNASLKANLNLIESSQQTLNNLDAEGNSRNESKYAELIKVKSESDRLNADLVNLGTQISELDIEIKSLSEGKCPKCNQAWISIDALERLKNLRTKKCEFELVMLDTRSKLDLLNTSELGEINNLKSKIDEFNSAKRGCDFVIESGGAEIIKIKSELNSIEIPEEVEFTEDNLNELMNIKDCISKLNSLNKFRSDLVEVQTNLKSTISKRDTLQSEIDELGKYNWYVCKSGPIYREIIEDLCESWSNDRVKFSLFDGVYRGNSYLDIKISYLKGREWQDYSQSSSGEKSYMDILFLKSVTSNAGFLILDEFLRHMDNDLTERSIEEIKDMNVKLFILSSFNPNLYFANRAISAKYLQEYDECSISIDS